MEYKDAGSVRLLNGIELRDLNENYSKGVDFEVDVNSVKPEFEVGNNKMYFDEKMLKYLNPWPDEEELDEFFNVTHDGGIRKKIVKEGFGPVIPAGCKVTVHYSLFEELNDEPFDSTRFRNIPHRFRLGQGMVIPAFEFILQSMKNKEVAHFIIKPMYGFGEMGCPPRIQPNMTICCEVEVLGFSSECVLLDDYEHLTEEEQKSVTLNDVLEAARAEREIGNQLCSTQQYSRAVPKYNRAIRLLEKYHNKNEEEENQVKDRLLLLYLNMALMNLKLARPERTITFCQRALEISPDNVKALFRYGDALIQLREFSQAKIYLLKAQKMRPSDVIIGEKLKELDVKKLALASTEKAFYRKMLSQNWNCDDKKLEASGPDKHAHLSADFITRVEEKLQDFKDSNLMEMPFPSTNFTADEMAFIIYQAERIGLSHSCKKVNGYTRMKFFKKMPSP